MITAINKPVSDMLTGLFCYMPFDNVVILLGVSVSILWKRERKKCLAIVS